MATLNIFQKYSQKENAITNNVLLLFSRLYENSPAMYEQFFSGLLSDENIYSVVPSFKQQVGDGVGIVDGMVSSKSSTIVIETKQHGKENIKKLLSYCDRFKNADAKILLHISSEKYNQDETESIKNEVKKIDNEIRFFSVTFEDIADGLHELKINTPYDKEIERLDKDFRAYCENEGLISDERFTMRAVACGESEYLNKEFLFYFDPEDRGFRPHHYIGIYYSKSVHLIGEIKAIVDAELVNGKVIIKKRIKGELTPNLMHNLEKGFKKAVSDGWKIDRGHKFFLCENMFETDFRKTSDYGIYSKRYFDLRDELEIKISKLPDINEIAEVLKSKTWE